MAAGVGPMADVCGAGLHTQPGAPSAHPERHSSAPLWAQPAPSEPWSEAGYHAATSGLPPSHPLLLRLRELWVLCG